LGGIALLGYGSTMIGRNSSVSSAGHQRGAALVLLIGIFKLAKAVFLVVLALVTWKLSHKDIHSVLLNTAHVLHIAPGNRPLHSLMAKSLSITRGKLELAALVFLLYAATFTVEGVGLVMRKRWAEWMTVITTAGLIPIEVYEIREKPGPWKIGALALNVAIAIYLAQRAWREGRHTPAHATSPS